MKLQSILILMSLTWFSLPLYSAGPPDWSIGLVYPDEESRTFLKAVLKSMDLPYKETKTDRDYEIRWKSKNKAQEQEIQNRVSQYSFIKDVCKNFDLPSPSTPARAELSCTQ